MNAKYLVANCRRNAEASLRNLSIPKIPSPWLRNGAHSKGSQPDSPFFGKDGRVSFCELSRLITTALDLE